VYAIWLSVIRLLRTSFAICSSLVEKGDQLVCGPIECGSLVINPRLYGLLRLAIEAIPGDGNLNVR
jgi:hypothetical protein